VLLINGTGFTDAFLTVDEIYGTGSPSGYIPAYEYGTLNEGTSHHEISGLNIVNGSYAIESVGALFGKLNDLRVVGSVAGIKLWFDSYGWDIENSSINAASYGQSPLELVRRSYLVNASKLSTAGGYYGLIAYDSGGSFAHIYNLVGPNELIGAWFGGSQDQFSTYEVMDSAFDVENGGSVVPMFVGGVNSMKISGIDFQCGANSPAVIVNAGGVIDNLDIKNSHVETNGSPSEIVDILSNTNLKNPVTWESGTIFQHSFATETSLPLSNDMGHFLSLPGGNPCVKAANLPTPIRAGHTQCISDWNGIPGNCASKGGAWTYHEAIWNGSNWQC
jgi:hypothetical protein